MLTLIYDELNAPVARDVSNKLFTTFTTLDNIENTIDEIVRNYTILYDKIFILAIEDSPEYVCTYNVDQGNVSNLHIMDNTILLHRQKHTNTLYSINAINVLVMSLNGGAMDRNFQINWVDYRNSILLTRQGELAKLNTKIHDIVKL